MHGDGSVTPVAGVMGEHGDGPGRDFVRQHLDRGGPPKRWIPTEVSTPIVLYL